MSFQSNLLLLQKSCLSQIKTYATPDTWSQLQLLFLRNSDNYLDPPFSTWSVFNPPSPLLPSKNLTLITFYLWSKLIRQSESLRMSSCVTQKPCACFLNEWLDDKNCTHIWTSKMWKNCTQIWTKNCTHRSEHLNYFFWCSPCHTSQTYWRNIWHFT